MKKGVIISIIVAIIIIAAGIYFYSYSNSPSNPPETPNNTPSTSATETTSGTNTISIEGFAFSPKTLTIKAGTTVTWTNKDSASHTVTSDESKRELNSPNLGNGASYSHTFNTPGTYNYHCTLHPMMKATIIVE